MRRTVLLEAPHPAASSAPTRGTHDPGRHALVAVLALLVALTVGVRWWQDTRNGVTPAHPLPARVYGSATARFVVAFGDAPRTRFAGRLVPASAGLDDMVGRSRLELAAVGHAAESVTVIAYPHRLSAAAVRWYLHVVDRGAQVGHWHGFPSATFSRPCEVGKATCPGRIAGLDVVEGSVLYALRATQVSAREARRFLGSFVPVAIG